MYAGDHISVPGQYLNIKGIGPTYRHHMIVKEVRGKDTLLVIYFSSETDDTSYDAMVIQQEYKIDPKDVRIVEYDSDHVYTGKDAIARAEGKLGTDKGNYSFIFNNCEHFCTYVKTDKKESKQVQRAVMVGAAGVTVAALAAGGIALYFLTKTESKEPAGNSTGKRPKPKDGACA